MLILQEFVMFMYICPIILSVYVLYNIIHIHCNLIEYIIYIVQCGSNTWKIEKRETKIWILLLEMKWPLSLCIFQFSFRLENCFDSVVQRHGGIWLYR